MSKRPDFQLIIADKTIYMFQHCRVEEIQFFFAPVFVQSKGSSCRSGRRYGTSLPREVARTEDIHADGPEGFLTYHSVIVGETADYKAYELLYFLSDLTFSDPDPKELFIIYDSSR